MVSTADMTELMEIINSSYADPHRILGMHEIFIKNQPALAVRVFIPQARKITVIDCADESLTYEMEKIHVEGFYEAIIPDRSQWFQYKLKIVWHNNTEWVTFDPYSFPPVLSEFDLHLFGEGTHYEIFEKLGAHPMVVNDIEGVLFAVWAPNARRVSVIGSFNDWDGRRCQMRLRENSGIWELFVPSLCKYDKYKYEIKTHSGQVFQKSDPYGNFFELRPSTATLVYDLGSYTWNDEDWFETREKTDVLRSPMNIYEVHLGSWKRHEEDNSFYTYTELADTLIPYVKEMNFNYIELMPVEEHPFDGSWGYQVTGYFAPTSRYGSPDEFMYFVDMCHQNGIGVILDWVPAHFPKDAHGLSMYDGSSLYEHQDPKQGEHPDWGTKIFNYGRKEVKNFLIGNAIFWIEKYHIDGLRVDAVASMLYLDYGKRQGEWVPNQYGGKENIDAVEFMRHMNSVILGRNPNVLMIAEESTAWAGVSRPAEKGGLGFNLKWNMGWMNDFLHYIQKEPIHRKYHHGTLTFSMVYAYTENFVLVLSHDEVVHGKHSLIGKMPGDLWQKCANLRLAIGFMYGHPGKKLLFMGSEIGQFDEWSEERPLDWFLLEYEHHRQLQKFTRDINALYLAEKALWFDDFEGLGFEWISCNDGDRSIVSFIRKAQNPEDDIIFVCNFTPVVYRDFRVGAIRNAKYKEILNSDNTIYGGGGVTNTADIQAEEIPWDDKPYSFPVNVPPLGFTVLKAL
ncbi:MAG: 1,4-alpha-glucan branching protein GlgB [Clostridiales bacterium]|jgi:1,4-alpha-glucan branching enzyme|nr:1,4-alpha-glucan branching protein GlgB [Clostridiales bacterium]